MVSTEKVHHTVSIAELRKNPLNSNDDLLVSKAWNISPKNGKHRSDARWKRIPAVAVVQSSNLRPQKVQIKPPAIVTIQVQRLSLATHIDKFGIVFPIGECLIR